MNVLFRQEIRWNTQVEADFGALSLKNKTALA
jgi:hypothetical protein